MGDPLCFDSSFSQQCQNLINLTKNNNNCHLNVAICYTSQHELMTCAEGFLKNTSYFQRITAKTIELDLLLHSKRPVDLLIRTSGETRLSDFMIWQSSHAYIHFSKSLWPNFGFYEFIWIIICFQIDFQYVNYLSMSRTRFIDSP
uniref:ditrans,polycis-polyprenyl diphosphate synthase [(2E,6E)-farnesyldiphosphate specific] n=1 Tax=Henneguya salminicola TaxID=69463 RepID=A0A6G3MGV9_HENSL